MLINVLFDFFLVECSVCTFVFPNRFELRRELCVFAVSCNQYHLIRVFSVEEMTSLSIFVRAEDRKKVCFNQL